MINRDVFQRAIEENLEYKLSKIIGQHSVLCQCNSTNV